MKQINFGENDGKKFKTNASNFGKYFLHSKIYLCKIKLKILSAATQSLIEKWNCTQNEIKASTKL